MELLTLMAGTLSFPLEYLVEVVDTSGLLSDTLDACRITHTPMTV